MIATSNGSPAVIRCVSDVEVPDCAVTVWPMDFSQLRLRSSNTAL